MILHVVLFFAFNSLAAILSGILSVFLKEAGYFISEILFMLAYLFGFLLPAWILLKMLGKCAVTPVKIGAPMPRNTALLTLVAVAINFSAAYFNQLLVSSLIPTPDGAGIFPSEPMTAWYQYVFLFLSTAVVPAICEEILFRGVILNSLIPFGRGTAILASGVLFGLMHGNIMQFFYTTMLGIVVGYIYVRTRSLWLCMLIHFVNNGIGVLQESVGNLVDQDLATQINSGIEIFLMIFGSLSLILLLISKGKKKRPEEQGSFGVVFEPSLAYEEYPITAKRKWSLFFAPTMIIFFVISGVLMSITLVSLLGLWVLV